MTAQLSLLLLGQRVARRSAAAPLSIHRILLLSSSSSSSSSLLTLSRSSSTRARYQQTFINSRGRLFSSSSSSNSGGPSSTSPQQAAGGPPPPGQGGKKDTTDDKDKSGQKEEISEKEAARQKKLDKIKEEIRRGYFYELGQVNRTGSKLFEADKELLPPNKAVPFPSLEVESLLEVTHKFDTLLTQAKNQVSLVALSFRDSGFRTLPDWIKPFQEEFASLPAMKVFQVSLEDKTWLKLLKFLLLNGQKNSIERERHGQTFLRIGPTEEIREQLGIDNRMVGYVFLVDGKGQARWRGTGRPTEEEIGSMLKCAHELYQEAASSSSSSSKSSSRSGRRR